MPINKYQLLKFTFFYYVVFMFPSVPIDQYAKIDKYTKAPVLYMIKHSVAIRKLIGELWGVTQIWMFFCLNMLYGHTNTLRLPNQAQKKKIVMWSKISLSPSVCTRFHLRLKQFWKELFVIGYLHTTWASQSAAITTAKDAMPQTPNVCLYAQLLFFFFF